jgi:hypothetical protein
VWLFVLRSTDPLPALFRSTCLNAPESFPAAQAAEREGKTNWRFDEAPRNRAIHDT